jgi:N6-adenosine-specific RNA methylase IME4
MLLEKTPNRRRVDIFARAQRDGWDTWGDEVGRLNDHTETM